MKSKKKVLFFGLLFITVGIFILCFFGYKHISREIQKQQLLKTSIVLDIPSADIYVPVVEGTDGDNLGILKILVQLVLETSVSPVTTVRFMRRFSIRYQR